MGNLGIFIVVGVALLSTLVALSKAQDPPVAGRVYAIQSNMDGGLLYPRGNGAVCEGLSDISFTYGLNPPYADRYRWRVAVDNSTGLTTVLSNVQDNGYVVNEITFDNYPPFCYLIYRELNLIPAGSGFIFRNGRDNTCLYSYGSEVGITIWRDCNEPYTQSFRFIELE